MKIRILGTAAAEGIPSVFCACDTCERARRLGGKDLRSRSSALFDGKHLIDLSPDFWYHMTRFGLDTVALESIFITHPHADHLSERELNYLKPWFAHGRPLPLQVYGNKTVTERVRPVLGDHLGEVGDVHEVEPFKPVETGEHIFTPVTALHMDSDLCLNYIVQHGGRTALYACDVGEYPDDTWEFFRSYRFDVVIPECTSGPHGGGKHHMNFEKIFEMKKRLEEMGSFSEGMYVLTHFSHNGGVTHDEIVAYVSSSSIQVAYDGMEIDI